MQRRFLITGGAGFIGSAVVRHLIRETDDRVCVVDKLTYAGNLASLAPVANNPRYTFVEPTWPIRRGCRKYFQATVLTW